MAAWAAIGVASCASLGGLTGGSVDASAPGTDAARDVTSHEATVDATKSSAADVHDAGIDAGAHREAASLADAAPAHDHTALPDVTGADRTGADRTGNAREAGARDSGHDADAGCIALTTLTIGNPPPGAATCAGIVEAEVSPLGQCENQCSAVQCAETVNSTQCIDTCLGNASCQSSGKTWYARVTCLHCP